MKKSVGLIVALFIFLAFNIVYAQEAIQETQKTTSVEAAKSFQEASNEFLEKDIVIPENINVISKLLFGIKNEDSIDTSTLIILLSLWIILIIIVSSILEIVPLFEKGISSWIAAIAITGFVSVTGGLKEAAIFILESKKLFGSLGNYSFFFILLSIILLGFLTFAERKLFHILKHKIKKETKREEGFEQGAGI